MSLADPGAFPHLRLRSATPALLALPWEQPLERWAASGVGLRDLPVGPSRHLVRFLVSDGVTFALKEMPLDIALREYEVLRRLEAMALPAVQPSGIALSPERGTGILVTEYLAHSLQYRRILSRFQPGPNANRDRLLDAMAWLLVDLHRSGVFWGDCSLANTLFRRDGDAIAAYLVDAETSEIHPSLSDGQRALDLDVLVENVAFGLADLAIMHGQPDDDDALAAAHQVRARYDAVWTELHDEPELRAIDRYAVSARVRRLNDLGFAVDEIELVPGGAGRLRVRVAVTNRRYHVNRLQQLTGLVALEGQARLLLNDLREYQAWVEANRGVVLTREEGARMWLIDVLRPRLDLLITAIGPVRDPLQAYCDVLEYKWLLSEMAGHDIGLEAAIESYLSLGAPAPEPVTLPDETDDAQPADLPGGAFAIGDRT